jgi:hypothetical protein
MSAARAAKPNERARFTESLRVTSVIGRTNDKKNRPP